MKKIFVYFLILHLSLIPTFRAWAFAPAVAIAFNAAASQPVRFLATEIGLSVVSRGFAANDPMYAGDGKLSKSKYLSFLKGKGKLVPFVAAGLAAAGFAIIGDQIMTNPSTTNPENDVSPTKDIAWTTSGHVGSTIGGVVESICANTNPIYCEGGYKVFPASSDSQKIYEIYTVSGNVWGGRRTANRVTCASLSSSQQSKVPTCSPEWDPDTDTQRPATDKEIESDFYSWVSSQPEHDQKFAFSDAKGNLHPDLKPDIQLPPPPTMPDGTPIPGVGHQLWIYADWIARGVAQSSDSTAPYYVPSAAWDNAYYLANTVAQGNQSITNSNANGSNLPDPDKPTDPDGGVIPDPNAVYKVEVTNIEQPLTQTQLENSYSNAATSLGASVDGMQDWTDDYFSQSESTLLNLLDNFIPDEWLSNVFDFIPTGTGSCVGWEVTLRLFTPDRDYAESVMIDAHCEPYDAYIRPVLEYSLWVMTLVYVYIISFNRLTKE